MTGWLLTTGWVLCGLLVGRFLFHAAVQSLLDAAPSLPIGNDDTAMAAMIATVVGVGFWPVVVVVYACWRFYTWDPSKQPEEKP